MRHAALLLPHREGQQRPSAAGRLAERLKPARERALAAMGLSSRKLHPAGHEIDVAAVDLGAANRAVAGRKPGGLSVNGAALRPDQFVMAIGYGECSPGYIPTDAASREGYSESQGWCWVAPEVEGRMSTALREAMAASQP